jgi:hypothetical protein
MHEAIGMVLMVFYIQSLSAGVPLTSRIFLVGTDPNHLIVLNQDLKPAKIHA